eukprot:gnl/MRDRNA2_/MRDRNA2_134472_c0_seq1.p1 gnl/MRDRNA2_/MRDRNA2_134472_c0~~gnl/MRDRNA2_/MRDRNA2_134472_c0_seq1.p1  ORF type:complete len:334 (+),score=54.64 gnl/MRDRNA2_/MRDRNA2_134472_c0_seq1:55-1056(+)
MLTNECWPRLFGKMKLVMHCFTLLVPLAFITPSHGSEIAELDGTTLGKPGNRALANSRLPSQFIISGRNRGASCSGHAPRLVIAQSRHRPMTSDDTRRSTLFLCGTLLLPLPALAATLPKSADFQASGAESVQMGQYERTMTKDADSGLLFQEVRLGAGDAVASGDQVAVDWACYTVHRGFIVQAKLLTKGGAFEGDYESLLRFKLDDGKVIGAINEAVKGMRKGGIRRIITVPGALYYPNVKGSNEKQTFAAGIGPVPSTFTGKRALDQVLTNPGLIDKSLVFDIELLDNAPGGAARRGAGTLVPRAGVTADTKMDKFGKRQAGGLYQGDGR